MSKEKLRKQFLEKRKNFNPRPEQLNKIFENFSSKIQISKNDVVAGYYPIASELNILPLLQKLSDDGVEIVLPAVNSTLSPMKFYSWKPGSEMKNSQIFPNILELKKQTDPVIPNIIIAPVVACDAKGNRIGLGKGFYDITLQYLRKKNPNLLYIGLCFDFQLIERIESAKHDQKLDIIITESQVIPILTYN